MNRRWPAVRDCGEGSLRQGRYHLINVADWRPARLRGPAGRQGLALAGAMVSVAALTRQKMITITVAAHEAARHRSGKIL